MAHTNKIPTAIPMLSRLTFAMAITLTLPGIAGNKYGGQKSESSFSLAGVAYI